ncbi:MAG: SRPBCC domain-containing protein [Bacteroidia bacterium]
MAQNGKASTTRKTFSRSTEVNIKIDASQETVWEILTDASDYPNWNSTIISLDGKIEKGEKIQLISTLDPERTFKLKVKDLQENESLKWGDGMGTRTFSLSKDGDITIFHMHEKIGGNPMFPLFAKMIPDFDESFEAFAKDLKREAESR